MCLTSEAPVVPVVALVVETGLGGSDPSTSSVHGVGDLLQAALENLARGTEWELAWVDVVMATYGGEVAGGPGAVGGVCCQRLRLGGGQGWQDGDAAVGGQSACASLYSALAALGGWLLKRAGGSAPVLVIHVTGGGFRYCADVERAAGTLKMACDFRGAPGVCYHILVGSDAGLVFPASGGIPDGAAGVVKSLHRMASPVGEWGASILGKLGAACTPGGRYFEAVPTAGTSLVFRFAGRFLSEAVKDGRAAIEDGVRACAFVAPKEGEMIDKCEDVVSMHQNRRRFAVSDGATTASYSAEWARALCRHAVESPPPALRGAGCELSEEDVTEDAGRLRLWLERALEYWTPEVPWERLVRPAVFNKAKEGSGASLAGIELLDARADEGVRFRAWALGDSCVIQLRGNQVFSSKPMDTSARFSHVPTLLMTAPGYEAKYVRFWQSWESVLAPGDLVLLGTDALCEYILRTFESGGGGEILAWLNDLSSDSGLDGWGRFEDFVGARRKDGQMKNDDVGLIIVEAR